MKDVSSERARAERILSWLRKRVSACESEEEPTIHIIKRARKGLTLEAGVKIGVFPSAFNPPTKAHAGIIKLSLEEGFLDEILLLLDCRHAHKPRRGATLEERLLLCLKAWKNEPHVSLGLSSHGLFVDKLQALSRSYPSCTSFTFIVGMDTLLLIMDPRFYADPDSALTRLFRGADFVVFHREGFEEDLAIIKPKLEAFRARIRFLSLPPEIARLSSTQVREAIRNGADLKSMATSSVRKWIYILGLYGPRKA